MTHAHAHNTLLRGARRVARTLREAGFQAWFVGGCVRDRLLGRALKDIDIATDARPEQVQRLFERTIGVGAQFGVIAVLMPEAQYEVATFRAEADYADGRRPTRVEYVHAEADVLRRDFTVNGLLENPETGEIADFVGGRADLAAGVLRAIGVARERFEEDHLRILRAVRFSAALRFDLEPDTHEACRSLAPRIVRVAAERVAQELRRSFLEGEPAKVLELLRSTELLPHLFPEVPEPSLSAAAAAFARLGPQPLPVALAILLHAVNPADVAERLKLSREERDHLLGIHGARARLDAAAAAVPGALALRYVRDVVFPDTARIEHALRDATGASNAPVEALIALLEATPPERLFPARLVDGNDLRAAGLRPGPDFKRRLDAVEDAVLEGRLTTRDEALAYALAWGS